jgi:hypothetical protein
MWEQQHKRQNQKNNKKMFKSEEKEEEKGKKWAKGNKTTPSGRLLSLEHSSISKPTQLKYIYTKHVYVRMYILL